jgi:hypothetical protein
VKPRVTLAAVLVAAVLGGGYWYWEVKTKPARLQAQEDAKRLFPELSADSTAEVLLRSEDKPQVLLRQVDGAWRLVTPLQALADKQAVEALLAELKAVKREEVVDEKGEDLRKYGLDKPSGAVTFKTLSATAQPQILFFGADSFDGTKAYALVNGKTQVFLTDLQAKRALLKDADGLRDKRLLPFDPSTLISIKSSAGFILEKDKQGAWQIRAGARVEPADGLKVDAWIAGLRLLKGDHVVDESGKNAGAYHLGASRLELAIQNAPLLVLQKGGLDGKGPNFFARMSGAPQVWSVQGQQSALLAQTGSSLMDLRAFDLQAGRVERLVLWADGNSLTARRKNLKWSWDGGGVDPKFSLEDFLATVAGTTRLSRLPASARPAAPHQVVTFYDDKDQLLEQVVLGPRQGAGQLAQSAAKKMVVIVADNVFAGLPQPVNK